MATAEIKFHGAAAGSVRDLAIGTSCGLTSDGDVSTNYLWTMVSRPTGSSATLATPATHVSSFTPDIVGTYTISLLIDTGLPGVAFDQKGGAVLTAQLDYRKPASGETIEFNTLNGWAEDVNDALQKIDDNMPIGMVRTYNLAGGVMAADLTVYISSEDATHEMPLIVPAISASGPPNGILTEAVVNTDETIAKTFGRHVCVNFDTDTAGTVGDTVYSDPADGKLTLVETIYPIGKVATKHLTTSVIFLDFQGNNKYTTQEDIILIEDAEDGAVAPGITTTIMSGNGKIRVRKFSATVSEDVLFAWEVPNNILANKGVTFQVMMLVTNSTGPSSQGISCVLSGYSVGDNDSINDTFGSEITVTTGSISASQYDRLLSPESDVVTITNLAAGEIAMLSLYRDHDHTSDDYDQDIGISGIRIFYTER